MLTIMGIYLLSFALLVAPSVAVFSGNMLTPLLIAASIIPLISCIKNKSLRSTPHALCLLALLAVVVLSALWSIAPDKSWQLGIRLMALCGLGYACVLFASSHTARLLPLLTIGNLLAMVVILIEYSTDGYIFHLLHHKRQVFELFELNKGATFLALSAWVSLSWLLHEKRWWLSGIFWLAVLLVLSRLESLAAILAFMVVTAVFFLMRLFPKKGFYTVLAALLIGLALLPVVLHTLKPEAIVARVPSLPLSAIHRLYIWEFASHKADEHPFLGWGASATRYLEVKPEDIRNPTFYPMPVHPHNQMLQLRFDLGLPGMALFIAFVGTLACAIRRSSLPPEAQAAAIASIIGYLVIGGLGYSIWHNWWIADGFFIAVGFASTNKNSRQQ